MNFDKQFDRWVLVGAVLVLGAICVFGMYIKNSDITEFGKYGFTGAWSALLIVINRELTNGNKEGSGIENPSH